MEPKAVIFLKRTTLAAAILGLTAGAALADNFGAIAFSQTTGAYGYSFDMGSRRDAETRAMRECRSRSKNCQVAIWFKNACGSVAIGANGWGSAWAGTRANAERAARNNCSKHTSGCKVLAWSCTTR
ncbi:MAG: hypothetical protein VR78_06945 [Hoeflea sp. BRH_c9]|nr:MAG: hypothetical protein VR78_06945 [Hoeflea sp. BRH_c9]